MWFPDTDAYGKWQAGRINFCGCTAKVRCLVHRESPQLILCTHRRVLSWLRKVGINVSSFVVHTHTGSDSCSTSTIE